MRILTFNWHEAYVSALARTGHSFDIVERQKGGSRAWFYETRPLPANARIVREGTARANVRAREYDLVICHNVPDLLWVRDYAVARILVLHNRLTTELALGGNTVPREQHRADVERALGEGRGPVRVVCISETKKADWGLDATVITPGIDLSDYGGYVGGEARILRVANFMKARDVMLGYTDQLALVGGRASTLLGLNEPEPGADVRFSQGWDDLKACFRGHRLFLNTTIDGFEDGYNLAMLEAMATGMPVVSTANGTSPLTDGIDGFVSGDRAYLETRIDELLRDQALAQRLGRAARQTVAERFALPDFVARWNRVFEAVTTETCRVSLAVPNERRAADPTPGPGPKRRILLSYVSYPATTARYIEDALRTAHEVVTAGPAMSEGLREAWNLQAMREDIHPQDIPTANDTDIGPIVDKLSAKWAPDVFLWVESVYGHFPKGVAQLGVPTACYLIDSHMNLSVHLEWARHFDYVFLAQREYIPQFLSAGMPRVYWLPLACDPVMHGPVEGPKRYDVGFVGSLTKHHTRRQALIGRLRKRFDVHVERAFLREMAGVLSASRIVFNDAVRRDLNMRVFETLCAGSFLLTDRATPSGLDELFEDGEHLAIYEDDTIEAHVAYYLAHEDEREAIAARGRAEVLARHTYRHRVETLLDTVFDASDARPGITTVTGRWLNDPLVLEAVRLMSEQKPDAAVARLDYLDGQRELSSWEAFTAGQIRAEALGVAGRVGEARAQHIAALAALAPAEREVLRAASL